MENIYFNITNDTYALQHINSQCANGTTCDNCLAIEGCTWCGETMGCWLNSFPPCIIGYDTCKTLQDCARSAAEYIGYDSPSAVLIIVVTVIGIAILVMTWIFAVLILDYKRRKEYKKRMRATSIQISEFYHRIDDPFSANNSDGLDIISPWNSGNSSRNDIERPNPAEAEIKDSRWNSCCGRAMLIMCTIVSLLVIISMILAVLLFPQLPNYFLCNRELDWLSIFESFGTAGTYKMLFTIQNTNHFPVKISNGHCRILYKSIEIGEYTEPEPTFFPQGSLVDVLADVSFYPTVYYAHEIYSKFQNDSLYIDFAITGDATIELLSWEVFTFPLDIVIKNQLMGAHIAMSMEKCNCDPDHA